MDSDMSDNSDMDDAYASDDYEMESPAPVQSKSNRKPLSERSDAPVSSKDNRKVEDIYQKKTQLEHILLRPDTYIGSTEPLTQPMWVWDKDTKKMIQREITYTPGLYKIFDEILVNAADNKQRDASMNKLKVSIDQEAGTVCIENNGRGIPVVMHAEHGVYIPEMIFGQLLTSSNYNDSEKKVTGGRNGYGAKLTNIFSHEFTLETSDSANEKKFKMTWTNNMSNKSKPKITKSTGADYTRVTFKPDFGKFNMKNLDDDTVALMCKRVYDMAGITDKNVKVYLDDKVLPIKNFTQYVDLYMNEPAADEKKPLKLYIQPHERWEIVIACSEGQFDQISFVNSICTVKGGQHVNYISDQITKEVVSLIKKKHKDSKVKPFQVKAHLKVFVNALIENPAFDSQTKETLTTRSAQFGSKPELDAVFMKKILKSELVERVLTWSKFKQNADLKRKGGKKKIKLIGIPKLDDANQAGSRRSSECTLILTEGDSAKSLAISGLSVIGRDLYGVFPLKGKLLNVRDATHSQHLKNAEIQNLVNILGLKYGTKYEDTKTLRYGHIMIMTDQDHDGSHIKGLIINFIHSFWPSLLTLPGFLQQFITPIVKATKGKKQQRTFFTLPEYLEWKEEHNNGQGWKIKYYKGLGTSTAAEAKVYFSDLETHLIDFQWDGDSGNDLIDMAFSKKRAEDRKSWLSGYKEGTHADYTGDGVNYTDFVNDELILFSMADNIRSLPSWVDGLKPAQRKVLYSCFKRSLKNEIKVAQLSGYVSEHSAYHHGEMSLAMTIVNMAQTFVGSNNINLLFPSGQFGTRIMGGKDAASARYIFTRLESIARCIFHPDDDAVLNYLEEDGQHIEPTWYMPVIPFVLVNGADGIGTGWSTKIPNYNPREIIANLRLMIDDEDEVNAMDPWYNGYTGTIIEKSGSKEEGNYTVTGSYEVVDDCTLRITELPLKRWTHEYKQFLECLISGEGEKNKEPFIRDFHENHTETTVDFTIDMEPAKMKEAEKLGIEKKFKLTGSISTSNFTGFDKNSSIKKYNGPLEVMKDFYDLRLEYYGKRKQHLVDTLTADWEKIDNKVRFILEVIDGSLVVSNAKKAALMDTLESKGYKLIFPQKKKKGTAAAGGEDGDDDEEDDAEGSQQASVKGYDYLLSMKLWSLTLEKVERLKSDLREKEQVLNVLKGKSPKDLWSEDLDTLEVALDDYEEAIMAAGVEEGKARKKATAASKRRKKNAMDSDSEEDWGGEKQSSKHRKKVVAGVKKAVVKMSMNKIATNTSTSSSSAAVPATKKKATVSMKAITASLSSDTTITTTTTSSQSDKKKISVKNMNEEEVEEEILSLADRLALRMNVTPKVESKSKKQQGRVPAKQKVVAKVVESSSSTSEEEDEEENEESDFEAYDEKTDGKVKSAAAIKKKATTKRATNKRPAAAKAATKLKETVVDLLSESDDDHNIIDDDDDDDDVFDFTDDYDPTPVKPKRKGKTATGGKRSRVDNKKTATVSHDDDAKQTSSSPAFFLSPDHKRMKVIVSKSKAKVKPMVTATTTTAVTAATAAGGGKKQKAPAKNPAKKATKKKMVVVEEDDMMTSSDDNEAVVVVKEKTSKPTRAGRGASKKKQVYYESSEEEEEESEVSEEEEYYSDGDDESDFE